MALFRRRDMQSRLKSRRYNKIRRRKIKNRPNKRLTMKVRTSAQRKAVRSLQHKGFYKKIGNLHNSIDLPVSHTLEDAQVPAAYVALVTEAFMNASDMADEYLSVEPTVVATQLGMLALAFESYMLEGNRALMAKYLETVINPGESSFLVVFDRKLTEQDEETLAEDFKFMKFEVVVEHGQKDPGTDMVSDITILEATPATKLKDPAGAADESEVKETMSGAVGGFRGSILGSMALDDEDEDDEGEDEDDEDEDDEDEDDDEDDEEDDEEDDDDEIDEADSVHVLKNRIAHVQDLLKSAPSEDKAKLRETVKLMKDRLKRALAADDAITEADNAMEVSNEIHKQLGRKAVVMIGAKMFVGGNLTSAAPDKSKLPGLAFKIGKNDKKVTHIRILLLPSDLYRMEFLNIRGMALPKVIKIVDDVEASQMHAMIRKYTGMETSLGTMGAQNESNLDTVISALQKHKVANHDDIARGLVRKGALPRKKPAPGKTKVIPKHTKVKAEAVLTEMGVPKEAHDGLIEAIVFPSIVRADANVVVMFEDSDAQPLSFNTYDFFKKMLPAALQDKAHAAMESAVGSIDWSNVESPFEQVLAKLKDSPLAAHVNETIKASHPTTVAFKPGAKVAWTSPSGTKLTGVVVSDHAEKYRVKVKYPGAKDDAKDGVLVDRKNLKLIKESELNEAMHFPVIHRKGVSNAPTLSQGQRTLRDAEVIVQNAIAGHHGKVLFAAIITANNRAAAQEKFDAKKFDKVVVGAKEESELNEGISDAKLREYAVPGKSLIFPDNNWWTIKSRDLAANSITLRLSDYAIKDGATKAADKTMTWDTFAKKAGTAWGIAIEGSHYGPKQDKTQRAKLRAASGMRKAPGTPDVKEDIDESVREWEAGKVYSRNKRRYVYIAGHGGHGGGLLALSGSEKGSQALYGLADAKHEWTLDKDQTLETSGASADKLKRNIIFRAKLYKDGVGNDAVIQAFSKQESIDEARKFFLAGEQIQFDLKGKTTVGLVLAPYENHYSVKAYIDGKAHTIKVPRTTKITPYKATKEEAEKSRKYRIEFWVGPGKGANRKRIKWERFGTDMEAVLALAKKAALKDYPDASGFVIFNPDHYGESVDLDKLTESLNDEHPILHVFHTELEADVPIDADTLSTLRVIIENQDLEALLEELSALMPKPGYSPRKTLTPKQSAATVRFTKKNAPTERIPDNRAKTVRMKALSESLPSKNTTQGFFNVLQTRYELSEDEANQVWDAAFKHIHNSITTQTEGIRDFLDSKGGRHLADELAFHTKETDIKGLLESIPLATKQTWVTKWIEKAK